MIIVSQDKEKIVNFDNLTQLYITQDEEETAYFIRFETVYSLYDDLGEYETEERAKEVLQEITTRHENWENMKVGQPSGICLPVYEMPED
jgi:hypothetical protein